MPTTVETLSAGTLADVLDRILDKGVVINADITVSVVGVELLGLQIRLALASFETAARYGLEFPSGTNTDTPAWRALRESPTAIIDGNAPMPEIGRPARNGEAAT